MCMLSLQSLKHQGIGNDLLEIKSYRDILRKAWDGHGSGIAIFIKDNICYKRLYNYERATLEAKWIQLNSSQGMMLL